jgi:sugar phosphate isomerase/epimerase
LGASLGAIDQFFCHQYIWLQVYGEEAGSSTYCLINMPLPDALEALSVHTDFVEVLSDAGHSLFREREVCESFSLRYSVHAPSADINIASRHEPLRRASTVLVRELAEICDLIGARTLVVHPGYMTHPGELANAERAFHLSLGELAVINEEHGVQIAIENMGAWDIVLFRDTRLLSSIAEAGLGFVLDIGHAHVNGQLDRFLAAGSPVHVHLHDNDGSWDSHSPCGAGSIDFAGVLRSLPSAVDCVVESTDLAGYLRSREYLDRIGFP